MKTLVVIRRCTKNWRSFSTKVSNVLKSKLPDVSIPKVPVHEYIFKNINKWADKNALVNHITIIKHWLYLLNFQVCQQTGRSYTYNELLIKSAAIAKYFRNVLKLHKGHTVAIVMPNVPEYPIVMLAASQASLQLTTVNPFFNAGK